MTDPTDSPVSAATMQINASELKLNMDKCLALASEQDIDITKDGRQIARLTAAADRLALLDELASIAAPADTDGLASLEEIKRERLESRRFPDNSLE